MRITLRALVIATVAACAAAGAGATTVASDETTGSNGSDDCCFANPRYTGICSVTPAPDETCADILAYLNNQASVGKTYCGNTKVRGGWAEVACDDPNESALGPHDGAQPLP
jgi:hypothetical protein